MSGPTRHGCKEKSFPLLFLLCPSIAKVTGASPKRAASSVPLPSEKSSHLFASCELMPSASAPLPDWIEARATSLPPNLRAAQVFLLIDPRGALAGGNTVLHVARADSRRWL